MRDIVIDADDFGPRDWLIPILEDVRKAIPGFKITLFTNSTVPNTDDETWLRWTKAINTYDWIEIAQHGYEHKMKEFDVEKKDAKKLLKTIKETNKLHNLKPKKIIKAPHWQCSKDMYKLLASKGYVVATDRNQVRPDIPGMVQYRWNWTIEAPAPNFNPLKGHGHTSGPSKNSIKNCIQQLMDLPQDANYLFVSEYIDKYGSD